MQITITDSAIVDNNPFHSLNLKSSVKKEYHFQIKTSDPHYPNSTGLMKKAVGINVKKMLQKSAYNQQTDDLSLYLLNYRSSKVAGLDFSPSELLLY